MKKVKKILNIIIVILLTPILLINLVILVNSFINPDEVPSFFGWKPFIVLSGSMEPTIDVGDMVIVKEVSKQEIQKDDIISFKTGDLVVTHRITDIIEEEGVTKYITKGDNNNDQDDGYVLFEDIEGEYKTQISGLGNLAIFIQTPIGMVISLSIPIILLAILQVIDNSRNARYLRQKTKKEKYLENEIEELKRKNEELTTKDDK